jgi:DNA mismatch repair ATPase MutS
MATMLGGATPRSLCLIDEFGKGTNTQDRSAKEASKHLRQD